MSILNYANGMSKNSLSFSIESLFNWQLRATRHDYTTHIIKTKQHYSAIHKTKMYIAQWKTIGMLHTTRCIAVWGQVPGV